MLKIRFFLICIFLCGILSANRIFGADYYSNAFRIFTEGRYYVASIEFERAIFYETDIKKIALCKYYKSLCYKGLGETTRSLEELDGINMFNLPDSLFLLIRYEQALGNYLNNDPNKALLNLEEIRFRIPDSLKTIDIVPLNILCMNTLRRWNEAVELWNYFLDNSVISDTLREDVKEIVQKLYSKNNIPKYRSPVKAEHLSRFVPGLGQIYCGTVGEGATNFLMNASLLGFAFYEFYWHYYFTGYFAGLGLFNKTYHGGMHRAGLLAVQKNLDGINNFNLKASSLMIRVLGSDKSKYGSMNNSFSMKQYHK